MRHVPARIDGMQADIAGKDLHRAEALPLTGGEIYAGDAAAAFQTAEPFAFLPAPGA